MLKRTLKAGCLMLLAIIGVIMLVGWALVTVARDPMQIRREIPLDVPPLAGEAVPLIDVNASGRTSDKLKFWSDPLSGQTEISGQALRAYGNATLIAHQTWPNCNLQWTTLAGIGWVETRHGTYSGNWFERGRLQADGVPEPKIIGPALDGTNGFMLIKDTDGGQLDGDAEFDRAVGPMQFIPSSWAHYGRDANGDGVADPQQIDDAALAAAALLCDLGRDLSTPEGWKQAIYSYNRSKEYLVNVRNAANSYAINQRP